MKKLQTKKSNTGIALITLVITIVVLTILAGVSINTVVGDDGIIAKAKDNANSTKETTIKESIEKLVLEYKLAEKGETLEDFLKTKIPSKIDKVTNNGDGTLTIEKDGVTVTVSATQTSNSTKPTEPTINLDDLQIGDYVNYTYDTASDYDTVAQTTGLKWRILDIDKENNVIDIISDTPTNAKKFFSGIYGYYNGLYYLNEICKAHYSNKKLIATVEPVTDTTIEDASDNGLTTTQTLYEIDINETNYGKAASVLISKNMYWIAARYVSNSTEALFGDGEKIKSATFGIRFAGGITGGIPMFTSDSNTGSVVSELSIRPLVSLEVNFFTGTKDSSGAWNLNYIDIKGVKQNGKGVLMPTGQSTPVCNIYDMGGNVWEWSTESYTNTSVPCTIRGGDYYYNYSEFPAGSRDSSSDDSDSIFDFRITLFM